MPLVELTADVIAAAQAQDSVMQMLYDVIRKRGQQPAWSEVQSSSGKIRVRPAQFASFQIKKSVLYRADGSTSYIQIVMPVSLRHAFLLKLQSSGSNVITSHWQFGKLKLTCSCEHTDRVGAPMVR
jgi:hypothetical protein